MVVKILVFHTIFSRAGSDGSEEEEKEEEEKKQEEEEGSHLLSDAFISPNHFLKEHNIELGEHINKTNTICFIHAESIQVVAFTFVSFFISCSLSSREELRVNCPCFNGNESYLAALPKSNPKYRYWIIWTWN